jgi:cell division GTPase FtsZ
MFVVYCIALYRIGIGLGELQKYVDTMIVTHNQSLVDLAQQSGKLSMIEAFQLSDEVLCQGVRTISDLIVKPGLVNLDFGDVQTVLRTSRQNGVLGKALMGTWCLYRVLALHMANTEHIALRMFDRNGRGSRSTSRSRGGRGSNQQPTSG